MHQIAIIHIFLIFFNFLFYNSIYPQAQKPQDKISQSSKNKSEICKIIKKLIEDHYNTQDSLKIDKLSSNQIDTLKNEQENNISTQEDSGKMIIDYGTNHVIFDSIRITPTITINNDEMYSKTQEVNLVIYAPNAIRIKLSNYEDFRQTDWIQVTSMKNWILTEGDGNKNVYLKLLYPDSSVSSIFHDEIILNSTPPIPKFTITPDTGIAKETLFTFDASASQHNYELFFRWDWENDGRFDTYWNISPTETYKFSEGGGNKEIRLEVKDSGGWCVSTIEEVIVFSRPQPSFDYSQNFQNPLLITFDASTSHDYEDGENLNTNFWRTV